MDTLKPVAAVTAAALALEIVLHPTETKKHVDNPEHHQPRPVANLAIELFTSGASGDIQPMTDIALIRYP